MIWRGEQGLKSQIWYLKEERERERWWKEEKEREHKRPIQYQTWRVDNFKYVAQYL